MMHYNEIAHELINALKNADEKRKKDIEQAETSHFETKQKALNIAQKKCAKLGHIFGPKKESDSGGTDNCTVYKECVVCHDWIY